MSNNMILLLLCTVLCLLGQSVYGSELSFDISPKQQECFYEDIDVSITQTYSFSFEVIRGGLLDIKLRVQNPQTATIIDRLAFFNHDSDAMNENEGKVSFSPLTSGKYSICFDNSMSRWTPKTLTINLGHDNGIQDIQEEVKLDGEVVTLDHLSPVVISVIQLSERLEEIQKLQHHLRVREQNHRDVQESSNSRTQWLAVIESIIMIGLTVFQVSFIRSWFNKNQHMMHNV